MSKDVWIHILSVLIILLLCVLIGGLFVMLLWNWLMPLIFGLPEITIWQSFGITLLTRLLFTATIKFNNQ